MYREATYTEKQRFGEACARVMYENAAKEGGIGTLGEKTLHAVLKRFYEPDETCREIKIGSFYADIAKGNRIIEIQTRAFDKLRKKLDFFLNDYDVTLVYPVAAVKSVAWIDENGKVSKKRKSPKKGTLHDIYGELYKIRPQLNCDRLHLRIVLLDITEYRYLDGWSKDKKRGSTRYERIPNGIIGQHYIESLDEYGEFVPENLSEPFTVKDFARKAKITPYRAGTALNILNTVNAVTRIGKEKNAYLYERNVHICETE